MGELLQKLYSLNTVLACHHEHLPWATTVHQQESSLQAGLGCAEGGPTWRAEPQRSTMGEDDASREGADRGFTGRRHHHHPLSGSPIAR
jgi:hypothetical protein